MIGRLLGQAQAQKEMPDVIVAGTLHGYVYVSEDGGDSWRKLRKEFGEIRSVAVTPN